ncbi:PAS domain S-box protein [Roseivirga sp.]|uniref:PAS domain S-box protein n=1 Tax=Roseivirga sp. TaxID=1964215 RepID=UPI002B26C011|nr:PAS domain S-box protein [Roseivirga sp.]
MKQPHLSNLFLNQSKGHIWVINLDLQLIYANKAYLDFVYEITGKQKKINESIFFEGDSKSDIKKWTTYYKRAFKGEYFEIEEHFHDQKSNETKYRQVTFEPLTGDDGKFFAIACQSKEISQNIKQRSEAKQLIDSSLDVFCTINEKGDFVYVSAAAEQLWGYSPEELIGKSYLDFVLEEDLAKTLEVAETILSGQDTRSFSNRYRKKDGGIAYNLWSSRWDKSTRLHYSVARDGKEKIEQEQETQLSQKRFESLVENSMDCIIIISPEGNTTYVSGSIKKILGYSPTELMEMDFSELVHPEDLPSAENALLLCMQHPGVPMKGYTSRVKHKNGSWRWIEPVITNLLHDPAVMGIVDNFRDITEQVEEQERLKLLESVITNTKDAVLITEAERLDAPGPKIIYVNEAFTKMTGYEAKEIIGKSPRILQGPNSNKEELAKLGRALRNGEPYEVTTINYKKSGEEFWINFTVTPVANEKGWHTHMVAIERDVTEQKNRELEKDLINTISNIFHQSIDNNLSSCLSNLCEHITKFGDFDLAEVWLPAIDTKSINRVANYAKGKAGNLFHKATKQVASCSLGEGLPGNVWENKSIEIWGNIEGEWLSQRKLAAKKAGIQVMIGVPLIHKDEVIGVLLLGTIKTKPALVQYIELFKKLESTIGSELSRKKIEIELAQIFDFTPDLICMAGFDGYIKRINPAGLALLGYSLEEIRSRPISSFLYEHDRPLTLDTQTKLYKGENLRDFENRYVTKQGEIIWLSWTATSTPDQEIVYAVAKDITKEKNLRELNREVGKLAKIGSWEVNLVNNTVFWSDEIHQIYGTDPHSFVPNVELSINFYREDFRDLARSSFEKCIITQEPYSIEAVIVNCSKKEVWVRTTAKAEYINGVCTRVYGSFQDIDDRKQSEIRLQFLASNLPGVIFQYLIYPDGTDNSKHVSEGSESVWGFSKEEVIQNNQLVWDGIKAGGEFEKVQKSISDAIAFKAKWTCRFNYVMPSGELRIHLGKGTPSFLTDGTILFNSIILDITQEAQNEELLNQTAQIARIGSWEMDLINQKDDNMYWSPMLREIVEVNSDYNPTLTGGIEFHIGESKERIRKALDLLINEGTEFDEEILLLTAKGNERWSRAIGKSEIVNNKVTKIYGSYQDIHQQKIANENLKKAFNEKNIILESIGDAFFAVDTEWTVTYWNKEAESLLGLKREEIVEKHLWEVFADAIDSDFYREYHKAMSTGEVIYFEEYYQTQNKWFDVSVYPSLEGLSIYFKDITAKKKSEHERKRLQTTLESSLNEIYIFDANTLLFSYVNKGALLNLGYSEQEIKALTPLDLKPDHTKSSFKELLTPLLSNERDKIVFFTNHKRKDESLYPVEVHLQLVAEDDNKRFLAVILDITERKKAEESILQANERFEKVTEATKDVIWDWDIKNNTFYRSDAIENFFGKQASKFLNRESFWKDSFHPDDLDQIQKSIEVAIADPLCTRWKQEYRLFNEDRNLLYVIDQGIIIRNIAGKATRMVGAMTDITEQKHMELQLSELNKSLKQYTLELERSNEELEQFAFVASHDLQEPLRMVSSFMDLLQLKYGDQLDEKGHQYIHFATDGAKRMKQIILDLLEYSRATRPSEGIEEVDMNAVLSDFKQLRRQLITEKSAKIKSNKLPTLNTYKAAITQILHCLIDNALKYSKEDTPPIIEIKAIEKDSEWKFSIKDNGIGIEPQFYEKIFIIFQRLHNKDKYSGTGIGLSIAKRHVEFLGGRIWLESVNGEGSVFYFTIPKTK